MSDQEPPDTPYKSKKNTRKWCKGKEGRPHFPVWKENEKYRRIAMSTPLVFVCVNCGKEMDIWIGVKLFDGDRKPPVIGSSEPLPKKTRR